ncbi:hypothetical protein E3U55_07885 [Filobacillus milosensis]|uniref:Uncharacterized protein n=1 Tax=Filobacillus milosensis TaxID=94137 RepID=A0A4Y8IMY3_9BACI|nr:hypothetical protein [Filobacillus milosensis]TFB21742.1 hypothetical protein E3U55_07885 [Filobacillus milosensis]
MSNIHKIIIGILVGSLALNLIFFFVILDQVGETKYYNNNQNVTQQIQGLQNDLHRLSNQVNDIHQSNQWVTYEQFEPNPDSSTMEEIQVDFEWAFKELENNAEISFLYREEGEKQWNELSVDPLNGLNYSAQLKLKPFEHYEYQILSEGEVARSTDIKTVPSHLYSPEPLRIMEIGANGGAPGNVDYFSIQLVQSNSIFPFFKPEEITAKILRSNGEVVERKLSQGLMDNTENKKMREELKVSKEQENYWNLEVDDIEDIASVNLRVEYANGVVHQGEVFPNGMEFRQSIESQWYGK